MLKAARVQMELENYLQSIGSTVDLFEECASFWAVRFTFAGELIGFSLKNIESPEDVAIQTRQAIVQTIDKYRSGITPGVDVERRWLKNPAKADAIEAALAAADVKQLDEATAPKTKGKV